jgi:hypothetical protein
MADDTFGAPLDFVTMPAGIGGMPMMDSPQTEDLPDLLRADQGGPSRWGMDAPSFGELEPTQCFPSATAAWGSGAYGPGAALAFGAGPSETFGAFGAQHQGQITDTAGTPFHPTAMPMLSMPYAGVAQLQHTMMPPPMHPQMMSAQQAAAQYGRSGPWMPTTMPPPAVPTYGSFAAAPAPPQFLTCAAFPGGMTMAMAMQMQGNAMVFQQSAAPVSITTATMSAPPAVVPTISPPLSTTNPSYNNGMCGGGGNDSGDEVVPAGPSCLLPRRNPGSIDSDDSGHLQVVPDQQQTPGAAAAAAINNNINNNIQVAAFPAGNGAVMLVPYNGGLMTVRRPAIATAAAAAAAAAAMMSHHHLSATSGSNAALPMLGVPIGSTRAASLERYRQKKASRSYSKHIRYHMRKVNADRRPRVKGRFIKASVVAEKLNNEMDAGDVV